MSRERLPKQIDPTEQKKVQFPQATRVLIHRAIDMIFKENPDADVEKLRLLIGERIQQILSGESEENIQEIIRTVREILADVSSGTRAKLKMPPITFSDEVLMQLAEMQSRQRYKYEFDRPKLAILGALLEATEPQTLAMLHRRTGYSGIIIPTIAAAKKIPNWTIKGNSKNGWTIERA
jgi:hypothetical protein